VCVCVLSLPFFVFFISEVVPQVPCFCCVGRKFLVCGLVGGCGCGCGCLCVLARSVASLLTSHPTPHFVLQVLFLEAPLLQQVQD
jgi:hypothetical protein